MSKQESGDTPQGTDPESQGPVSFLGFVASGVWKLASGMPRAAVDLAHKGMSEAERRALNTLRKRMDAVAGQEHEANGESPGADMPIQDRRPPAAPLRPSAAALLAKLMEASLEQTAESARELLHLRLVRQLVPDEARILAALADGHGAPLVHLGAGPLVGPASQRWLENLSPVGRECGVRLLDQTSVYVTHLRRLGLLESDDEDKTMQIKYQLIEADTLVRKTCAQIEKAGLRPRFFRRTIRISDAGRDFWAACAGDGNKSG